MRRPPGQGRADMKSDKVKSAAAVQKELSKACGFPVTVETEWSTGALIAWPTKSSTAGRRPKLQRMLANVKGGRIQAGDMQITFPAPTDPTAVEAAEIFG